MQYAININFGTKQAHIFKHADSGDGLCKSGAGIRKVPGVEKISAISVLMGTYGDWADDVRTSKEKDPVTVREYFTDEKLYRQLQFEISNRRKISG
jgi:hypothetical protein